MKESTLGASERKAKRRGLLDERGRRTAKVSPLTTPAKSLCGSWKGVVKIKGEIVHFNETGAWENG